MCFFIGVARVSRGELEAQGGVEGGGRQGPGSGAEGTEDERRFDTDTNIIEGTFTGRRSVFVSNKE